MSGQTSRPYSPSAPIDVSHQKYYFENSALPTFSYFLVNLNSRFYSYRFNGLLLLLLQTRKKKFQRSSRKAGNTHPHTQTEIKKKMKIFFELRILKRKAKFTKTRFPLPTHRNILFYLLLNGIVNKPQGILHS